MLEYPPSQYQQLTVQEAKDALDIAVRLNWKWLRQGRMSNEAREQAARFFADALVDHLTLANMALFRGPPMRGHSTPTIKP
jgi:hypothetical protein